MAIIRKTPEEIEAIAASGRILARCHRLLRGKARPGVTTGELDEAAEKFIRSQGAEPVVQGLPRLSRARSAPRPTRWWCTASPAPTSSSAATCCRWTSAWSSTAGSPTPRSRCRSARSARSPRGLLDTTRGVAVRGPRAGPGRQPPRRRLRRHPARGWRPTASRSSARWWATGSGATCTRTRRSPTSASPAPGPELEEGMVLAIEPMVNAGGHEVRMGTDGWAVYSAGRLAGRPLRAHRRRSRPTGPRILTPWHEEDGLRSPPQRPGPRAGLSALRPMPGLLIFPRWRIAVSWAVRWFSL